MTTEREDTMMGRWTAHVVGGSDDFKYAVYPDNFPCYEVALVQDLEFANAIAAVPEMIAALAGFRAEFGSYDSHCGYISKLTAMADAALAKARGETP